MGQRATSATVSYPVVSDAFNASFRALVWSGPRRPGDSNPIKYACESLKTATLAYFTDGLVPRQLSYLREWCVQHDLLVRRPRGAPRVPALWSSMASWILRTPWGSRQVFEELPALAQTQVALERAALLRGDDDVGQALDDKWRDDHLESAVRYTRRVRDALQAWRRADGIADDADDAVLDAPGVRADRAPRGGAAADENDDAADGPAGGAAAVAADDDAADAEDAADEAEAEAALGADDAAGGGGGAGPPAPQRLSPRRYRPATCKVPRQFAMGPQRALGTTFVTFDDECLKSHLRALVVARGGVINGLIDDIFRRGGIHRNRALGNVVDTDGHALTLHYFAPSPDPYSRATRGSSLKETKAKVVSGAKRGGGLGGGGGRGSGGGGRGRGGHGGPKAAAASSKQAAAGGHAKPKPKKRVKRSSDDEDSESVEVEDAPSVAQVRGARSLCGGVRAHWGGGRRAPTTPSPPHCSPRCSGRRSTRSSLPPHRAPRCGTRSTP